MTRGLQGRWAAAVAAAAMVALLAGCDQCKSTRDCPWGQVCVSGSCEVQTADTATDGDADASDQPDTADTDAPTDPDAADPDATDTPTDEVVEDDVPVDEVVEDAPCTSDLECADSNPCTLDYCHLSFHFCVNQPQDGLDCGDTDLCNGVDTCNEAGTCVHDSSPLCDDGNPCTYDTCVSSGADCTWDPSPMSGTPCDDGLFCDGIADVCTGEACMPYDPGYRACDDGNSCTFDTCTESGTGPLCENESTVTFRAITCGLTVTGVTDGPGEMTSYGSCSGTLGTGPEEVIMFVSETAATVTFTLVADPIPTADSNELFVLADGCEASTCTQVGTPSVTVPTVAAGTPVYVSVESVVGGAYFAVQATCS